MPVGKEGWPVAHDDVGPCSSTTPEGWGRTAWRRGRVLASHPERGDTSRRDSRGGDLVQPSADVDHARWPRAFATPTGHSPRRRGTRADLSVGQGFIARERGSPEGTWPVASWASTSISTRQRASRSPATTTIVAAGRAAPNTSACAWATASASARSTRYIRVRTASSGVAPSSASAVTAIWRPRLGPRVGVARAIGPDRRRAGHEYPVTDPDGPGETHPVFVHRS